MKQQALEKPSPTRSHDLFSHLSPEERLEAEERVKRYFKIVLRITDSAIAREAYLTENGLASTVEE